MPIEELLKGISEFLTLKFINLENKLNNKIKENNLLKEEIFKLKEEIKKLSKN